MKSRSVEMRGKVIRNQAQYLRKIKVPHYSTIPNDERQRLKVAFRNYDHSEATRICERIYEKYE
jgi:adenine-specific DNA-methyltransferase